MGRPILTPDFGSARMDWYSGWILGFEFRWGWAYVQRASKFVPLFGTEPCVGRQMAE
jgi:hypothetical protein